jgi:fructose/tagatose bisphosphate aldolase
MRFKGGEGGPLLAFNFYDQHDLAAIVCALNESSARGGVLLVSATAIRYAGLELLYDQFQFYQRRSSVPLWIELDHCRDLPTIERAAEVGFDILMADFSHLPKDDNISQVAKIVDDVGGICAIEGEASPIPDLDAQTSTPAPHEVTTPAELREFVTATGCDLVAPHLGTNHGLSRHKPPINQELVRELSAAVLVPIVAHGCDFLAGRDLQALRNARVGKLNFGPQLRAVWNETSHRLWATAEAEPDHRAINEAARRAVAETVKTIVRTCR